MKAIAGLLAFLEDLLADFRLSQVIDFRFSKLS